MRNIVYKKVALNGGWRSHEAVVMLKVDHLQHKISYTQLSDNCTRNIDFKALIVLLITDKDILKELRWVKNEYKRVNPASVDFYEGVSGCRQWSVNVHRKGYEDVIWRTVASFYVSAGNCAGYLCSHDWKGSCSCEDGIFSGDLALILDAIAEQPDIFGGTYNKGTVQYLKFHKPAGPGKRTTRMWVDPETGKLKK